MSFGASERNTSNAGIYLGTVTKVTGDTASVEVPRLAKGFDYPARYPAELAGEDTEQAGGHTHGTPAGESGSAGAHVHGLRPLAKGDPVAVAFLEGGRDELVILIRLA